MHLKSEEGDETILEEEKKKARKGIVNDASREGFESDLLFRL